MHEGVPKHWSRYCLLQRLIFSRPIISAQLLQLFLLQLLFKLQLSKYFHLLQQTMCINYNNDTTRDTNDDSA